MLFYLIAMKRVTGVFVAAAALALAPVATAEFDPAPVLTTPANEVEPAPEADYFAWAQASVDHPNRYNVWVAPVVAGAPDVSSRHRANPSGSVAFAGDMDGRTLVFGQRPSLSDPGSVRFYNAATKTLLETPAGVNTSRGHEAGPRLSGNWLLFARYGKSGQGIILFNTSTRASRRLDSLAYPGYLQTGGVAGNWAVWTRCKRWAHCSTIRYRIDTKAERRVPNPNTRSQYAASVTDDGTVYFGESRNIFCGRHLGIWRWSGTDGRQLLHSVPSRRDVATTNPLVSADGTSVDVYFDHFNCDTGRANILKITVPPFP
jgi:hypothetical protein